MRYFITLTPLEPYLFGGDNTFGKLGDDEAGTYLVTSQRFPQQSALLGMFKKEIMTQGGVLTRKLRGEWVDKAQWSEAKALVGIEKFDFFSTNTQDLGAINNISPLFLTDGEKQYIKKADIDRFPYENGLLKGYNAKLEGEIYDNYITTDGSVKLRSEDLFVPVEKIANKKGGAENSLFKKTSYTLKEGFAFGCYLECDYELTDSIVTLGADRSSFKMRVQRSDDALKYVDSKGYLTLLSDTYITLPLRDHCQFAISSEISFRSLKNKKNSTKHHAFEKSSRVYLYERGTVIIDPSEALIEDINKDNLQKIGYNIYSKGEK